MAGPLRPRLRPLEIVPVASKGSPLFALRDPQGFCEPIVMPHGAALVAALMDGRRTLAQIQAAFRDRVGVPLALADLKSLVGRFDEAHLLQGDRFEALRRRIETAFLNAPVRPAAHAGRSYPDDPDELRQQLADHFDAEKGPGAIDPSIQPDGLGLCGAISPHIDLYRGGPAYAWAYKRIVEQSDADVFVIFGTAHGPMGQLFAATRKDFDTPLGVVQTDRRFLDRLAERLASSVAGRLLDLDEDELAHRAEHSVEFQAVYLQYVLGGRRPFRIVPVLTGSFDDLGGAGVPPAESPEVQTFLAELRRTAEEHRGKVCYVGGADLAHVGQRFGDRWIVDARRRAMQERDDRALLAAACRGDAASFFRHVAEQGNRSRICGLSPIYMTIEAAAPTHGELLTYDQAVEPDGSACVSFASVALYRRQGGEKETHHGDPKQRTSGA